MGAGKESRVEKQEAIATFDEIVREISTLYDAAAWQAETVITDYQRMKARRVISRVLMHLAPPPDLSTAQWADEYRYIAGGTSAHPGKWRTDKRPFLRGIMDAFDDPIKETVTIKKASRMGVTECINNKIGRHIHYDPCAMLYVQQTLGEVKKYNQKIFHNFVRATHVVRDILPPEKSRSTGNTIFEKTFPGGSLTLVGANTATGFRMIFVKIVFLDDVDGFEWSVGKEGDPVDNAIGRTSGVWDKKIILASKPTVKAFSRIDLSYEQSDKQLYHVPCPQCDHGQVLRWGGKDLDFGIKWDNKDPYTAYYLCEQCHGVIRDFHKEGMNRQGQWIATAVAPRHAGFGELSQLYHPDIPFSEIAASFLRAQGNPEQLQVWTNDRMGECWEDRGEGMSEDMLFARREAYGGPMVVDGKTYQSLPEGVALLTAQVDVHDENLVCSVDGWGRASENWGIDYVRFEGDTLLPEVWDVLDEYLLRTWWHPAGVQLRPVVTVIDSGYRDEMVSAFVRSRAKSGRNIIAIKGDDRTRTGQIISDIPNKKNKYKVHIYTVNVNRAKTSVFGRLKIAVPGQGAYMHFPVTEWCDKEYFEGLLSERWVTVRMGGVLRRKLVKRPGVRNEPLDLKGYSIAAIEWLFKHRRFDLDGAAERMFRLLEEDKRRRLESGNLDPVEYFRQRAAEIKQREQNAEKSRGRRVISKGVVDE